MAEKPKKNLVLSGKGVAVFPHLNTPDTKFKDEGEFHVKLRQPADVAAKNVKMIDEMMDRSAAEAKEKLGSGKKVKRCDTPYSVDEETGDVTFTFKTKASGKKKDGTPWTRSLAIYDAQGVALKKAPNIGGGSILNVSFEPSTFFKNNLVGAGVTLRLEAVQIIELKEWSGRDAKSFGFGKEEGYSAEESGDQFPTESDTESTDEETDGDEEEKKNAADF